jgi:hypothetical protein
VRDRVLGRLAHGGLRVLTEALQLGERGGAGRPEIGQLDSRPPAHEPGGVLQGLDEDRECRGAEMAGRLNGRRAHRLVAIGQRELERGQDVFRVRSRHPSERVEHLASHRGACVGQRIRERAQGGRAVPRIAQRVSRLFAEHVVPALAQDVGQRLNGGIEPRAAHLAQRAGGGGGHGHIGIVQEFHEVRNGLGRGGSDRGQAARRLGPHPGNGIAQKAGQRQHGLGRPTLEVPQRLRDGLPHDRLRITGKAHDLRQRGRGTRVRDWSMAEILYGVRPDLRIGRLKPFR